MQVLFADLYTPYIPIPEGRGFTALFGKEIRELEENSKRIIENMRPQTIAQYHIKQWLDDNFIMGCARLEYTGKDTAKVMDTVGGVMYVEYKNGEVRECQK